jgi:ankyrin repeat protein
LLRSGANVNATGGSYGSAIQAASYEGHKNVVALLIWSGANVNPRGTVHRELQYMDGTFVKDTRGFPLRVPYYQSPLSIAREKGYGRIVKLLEDAGAIDFCDLRLD